MDTLFNAIEDAFKLYFQSEDVKIEIVNKTLKVKVKNPQVIDSFCLRYAEKKINSGPPFNESKVVVSDVWAYKNGVFTVLVAVVRW